MEKSIIIIGAGIAGLSAGCYGQMNGYRTQIFEMHDLPGGLCTSWKRKGYTFDGCIHWLVGSRPGTEFHRIWEELGTVQGRRFVDYEEFIRIEGASRKTFILYTDPDRLEQHMKELSPQDAGLIKELCNGVRLFTRFDLPIDKPRELYGLLDGLKMAFKMLPFMKAFGKYGKTSIQDFSGGFSDPFLREAFPLSLLFDQPYPVFVLLMILALMHNRNAGYPIGGSLPFARAIERRYLDLGGEIHYNSQVEKILVEPRAGQGRGDDRAVGVRLADGAAAPKERHADAVISAADGRATIFDMLETKYTSDEIRSRYDEWPVFPPIVQVSLGVARDLSNEPHMVTYLLEDPITVGGEVHSHMGVKNYGFDPTLAPAGKSVLEIIFGSSHEYWKAMYEERERYEAEKQQIAMAVIGRLEKRFPGITGQVEAVDVATPMTTERYTGNWQGSIMGWATTTETMGREEMSKTLPGLKDFYMIGQWVEGGGLPPAARSGRDAIHIICHQDNRPFVTHLP
jgi:phytoene dehydrogenase-like protein